MNYRGEMWEGGGGQDGVEWEGRRWDNYNSIINKYIKKKEKKEKWARDQQASCIVPSLAPPPQAAHSTARKVALPGWICKAPPPYNLQLNRGPKQRNMAQMKEHSKTSERELSDEEIANLSDGEFKALVIKMLTELSELGRKWKNKCKIPKMK